MHNTVLRVQQSWNAIAPGSEFFRLPNDTADSLYALCGCGLEHCTLPMDRLFSFYSGRAIRIDVTTRVSAKRYCAKTIGETDE